MIAKLTGFIDLHKEFLFGLLLTLSLLWPMFAAPYFSHHDDVQLIRLYEMDKCIQDGQIPCRWVPNLGGEYGYPLFNYYAPLAYYYGEIFYLLTGNLIIAAKVMFATTFVGAFIFMYLFCRKLWGEKGGVLSAIFFSFAPYHGSLLYVRGAMGELWGVMFFPAILWSILRLKQSPKLSNLLLLSIFIAGLILSHNLSTLIFMPFIYLFTLFLLLNKGVKFFKEERKFLGYFILATTVGLLISAVYWLPVVFEKNLVHVETTTSGYFHYTEHFKGLRKLVLERAWGWGSSELEVIGRKDGMSFQIGWIHLLVWLLGIYAGIKLFKQDKRSSLIVIFSSIATLMAIFMIHPRSEFVWKLIGPLEFLQFPWRFLGLVMFFISIASGAFLLVVNNKYTNKVFITLAILVVVLNFSYFRPEKFFYVKSDYIFESSEWDKQIKRSIFDYLPKSASEPPAELAKSRYELLTGEADIKNIEEGSNWFKFTADTKSHTIIRWSQYYFPNWIIKVDGEEVKFDYENHLGLMTIILGEGSHQVEGRLFNTTVRSAANMITFITLLIVVVLSLLQIPKVRKGILYYLSRIN